jgi:hypothetical protein
MKIIIFINDMYFFLSRSELLNLNLSVCRYSWRLPNQYTAFLALCEIVFVYIKRVTILYVGFLLS